MTFASLAHPASTTASMRPVAEAFKRAHECSDSHLSHHPRVVLSLAVGINPARRRHDRHGRYREPASVRVHTVASL
jgi:hypothetical protein